MKNIQSPTFAVLLCMATLLTSCITNNSVYEGEPISLIKFSDSLNRDITTDKLDTLVLEAPRFTQTNVDKPVRYEWEIDYKKVGSEKVLKHVCAQLGEFKCRLKISNEDGAAFYTFNLIVKSPYHQGLMVMSNFNNKAMFSFKREDIADKSFYTHVYADNNPKIPLGNEPQSVFHLGDFLFFATNNPARLLKVDARTMEALLVIDYPGENIGKVNATFGYQTLYIMGNGVCYQYEVGEDLFTRYIMGAVLDVLPNAMLSNSMTYAYNDYYQNFPYFFDEASGNLITIVQYKARKIEQEQLKGKKMLHMIPCNGGKEILMLLQEIATSDIYLAHYIHQTYTLRSIKKIPIEEGKTISACVANPQSPLFYYGIDNKVYVHNYLADNFSDKPLHTIGNDGDKIASLLIAPEKKSKFYIGLNRQSGNEYRGDVFCFDVEKSSLLWKEEGVAGEIVFMAYKK